MAAEYTGRFGLAETVTELQRVGGELTAAVKTQLMANDLERVRKAYAKQMAKVKPQEECGGARNGTNGAGTDAAALAPAGNG